MRGLVGSMARSLAPVCSLTNRTFFQVLPPSGDRKTPRSSFGPQAWPWAATYTRSGLRGSTRTLAIWYVPLRPTLVHEAPASVDLYTPSPCDTFPRVVHSPIPA